MSEKMQNSRGLRVFQRSINYAKKRLLYILLFIKYLSYKLQIYIHFYFK